MTAAFFERDTLFERACIHFGCGGSVRGTGKKDRERAARRRKVGNTIDRFREVMSSKHPPQTKQEAVEAVACVWVLILSAVFKSLVIELVEWLWDQTQEADRDR